MLVPSVARPAVSCVVLAFAGCGEKNVKRGDLLYVIEPVESQKTVENARASLARAAADLATAQARERRLAPLVKDQAISQQDYDDAMTAVKQQEAAVASARATLDRAEIDLG